MYFIFTTRMDAFLVDYCEAWSRQPGYEWEIILFMDNGHRIAVPCSSDAEDRELVRHLRIFYDLSLANGGLAKFLGLKSCTRIDIVEVWSNVAQ
jgi:hypothetical protein